MADIKPGWQTTEFWVTVAVWVLAAYIAVDLHRPTPQVIAALAAAALKAAYYVSKRTELKVGST